MLIYGESEISADKKTIKQFLQPMIEQVWGGGGGGECDGRMCRFFSVSYSELLYFCVGFFQLTDAFFGSILPIFAYFCCILSVFHQKIKQCFGHKIFVMYN